MKTRSITPINNNRAFYYAYYISDRGGQSVIVTRSWPRFLLLRRILETIRFYLTFAVQLCAFPHNPRGSKWIGMILFSFIFPVSFLTRSHRDVVKSRSESVLRFNFMLRCKREWPQEIYEYPSLRYIYIYRNRNEFYSVSGSNVSIHNVFFTHAIYLACKRTTARGNRARLDFEIRNVFVTSRHGSRRHETDDKKKNARTSIFELACF